MLTSPQILRVTDRMRPPVNHAGLLLWRRAWGLGGVERGGVERERERERERGREGRAGGVLSVQGSTAVLLLYCGGSY